MVNEKSRSKESPPPHLLDLRQAATILGIAPVTLRLWTYGRKIAYVQLGRRKLFHPDELARIVRVNTVTPLSADQKTRTVSR